MEQLRQQVRNGNVELARLSKQNKPEKIQLEDVEKAVEIRNKASKLAKELSNLSWEEKYEWVNLIKLKGNKYYADKLYNQAIQTYLQALIGLDYSDKARLSIVKNNLQYPILINIATCYYQLKDYNKGILICNKVLEEVKHPKCLFKKGRLLASKGDHEEALVCLRQAYGLTQDEEIKRQIMQYYKSLKSTKLSQRSVFKKMFEQEEDLQDEKENLLKGNSKKANTAATGWIESSQVTGNSEDENVLVYEEETLFKRLLNCLKNLFHRGSNTQPKGD